MEQSQEKFLKKQKLLFLILITILLFLFLLFLAFYTFSFFSQRKAFEEQILSFVKNNETTIFSIDEITFFSSTDCKNKASSQTNFTLENLYTYTDIAFFIHNHTSEYCSENTLKSLEIRNVKFTILPSLGSPKLYYKNLNQFTKSDWQEQYPIESNLAFDVTAEETIDFSKPTLYNNYANPITLSYQNENVKTDYTITNTSIPITYNGTLLKRCGISLDSLSCTCSFDLFLVNQKDQKFKTTVSFSIPYEEGESSILDGSITVKKETNFKFYRYE